MTCIQVFFRYITVIGGTFFGVLCLESITTSLLLLLTICSWVHVILYINTTIAYKTLTGCVRSQRHSGMHPSKFYPSLCKAYARNFGRFSTSKCSYFNELNLM